MIQTLKLEIKVKNKIVLKFLKNKIYIKIWELISKFETIFFIKLASKFSKKFKKQKVTK